MSNDAMAALSGQAPKVARAVYLFTVPKALQKHGVSTVGIRELAVSDEKFAGKRAGDDRTTAAHAMAVQSLAEVDGKEVSTGDGSAESAFNGMHPKVRELVLHAYLKVNVATEADTEDFLSSCQVRVA